MAVSSYYTSLEEFEHELNSDISSLSQAEMELFLPELFLDNFDLSDPFCNNTDCLFDTNGLFYSENCNSLFPDPPDSNLNSTLQELDKFHCPKRQKIAENYQLYYSDFKVPEPDFINGLTNCKPELILPPLPCFSTATPVYNGRSFDSEKKPPASGGSLSAQSIAARQRRRKISEKTRELSKLIPGGNRMNTAEMFQSAYKYIKFLQAQVVILELIMGSAYHKENESEEELHGFLESRLVQEKLYSKEKCLVPQKFVQEVTNDDQIFESKPLVVKELRKLERTNLSH